MSLPCAAQRAADYILERQPFAEAPEQTGEAAAFVPPPPAIVAPVLAIAAPQLALF